MGEDEQGTYYNNTTGDSSWLNMITGCNCDDECKEKPKKSNGGRSHHPKLGKKISELCQRITELEKMVKILRASLSDDDFNFLKYCVKQVEKQQKKAKREFKKLEKVKEKFSFLGGL